MTSHRPIRIWDLPLRLFHWALVLCVVGLVVSAQIGGNAMVWHFRFGYAVISLLLFRLLWGLLGGHWSRFSSFLYAPSQLLRYLRGRRDIAKDSGHSPLGALSVFAMLIALVLQVSTGLFSDDEISAAGPMTALVSNEIVSSATFYHTAIGKKIVLALILLHLVAIGYYSWVKRQALVRAMITGDKVLDPETPASQDTLKTRLLALGLLASCGAIVAILLWVVSPT